MAAGEAVHDPGKVLLDLALMLAFGGDCLADIALLRAEPGLFGRVASDPTVSRTVDALAADADRGVEGDRHRPGRGPRRECGRWPASTPRTTASSAGAPLVIDIDATLVTAHSDKEGAAPTFKRGFGYPSVVGVRRSRVRRHRGAAGGDAAGRERRLQHRRRPHHRRP